MTVYVTGDIHGGLDMQKLRDWELGDSLTSDDYLIVAGCIGVVILQHVSLMCAIPPEGYSQWPATSTTQCLPVACCS